jgi:hypothetical protein
MHFGTALLCACQRLAQSIATLSAWRLQLLVQIQDYVAAILQ